ncbi:potassium transporter TrkA, partial [Streptomyces fradiae]
MVVCGDDALAHRLAYELHDVYRERVTLLVPGRPAAAPREPGRRAPPPAGATPPPPRAPHTRAPPPAPRAP